MEKALEKNLAVIQGSSEELAYQFDKPASIPSIPFLEEAKTAQVMSALGSLAKNQHSNSAIVPGFIQSEI